MASAVEAVMRIREFSEQTGRLMKFSEVLLTASSEFPCVVRDREEQVVISGVDRRYVAARTVSGLFAGRCSDPRKFFVQMQFRE